MTSAQWWVGVSWPFVGAPPSRDQLRQYANEVDRVEVIEGHLHVWVAVDGVDDAEALAHAESTTFEARAAVHPPIELAVACEPTGCLRLRRRSR
jgi:hypothetical protein